MPTDKQTCSPSGSRPAQHHEEKSHEALFRAWRLLTLAPYRVTRSRADIRPGERQPSCNTSPTWPRHRDLSRPQAAKSVTAPRNGSISSPQNLRKNFSPLFRPNTPDDYKPIAKDNLANRFAYVDKHLSNRPYLVGDKFTVADAYLFTILNWAKFQSIDLAP